MASVHAIFSPSPSPLFLMQSISIQIQNANSAMPKGIRHKIPRINRISKPPKSIPNIIVLSFRRFPSSSFASGEVIYQRPKAMQKKDDQYPNDPLARAQTIVSNCINQHPNPENECEYDQRQNEEPNNA